MSVRQFLEKQMPYKYSGKAFAIFIIIISPIIAHMGYQEYKRVAVEREAAADTQRASQAVSSGDYVSAIKSSLRVLEIYQQHFPVDDPKVLMARKHVADIYLMDNQIEEARTTLQDALSSVHVITTNNKQIVSALATDLLAIEEQKPSASFRTDFRNHVLKLRDQANKNHLN